MKTNAAFIVRYRKEGELFDTTRVVTEGVLLKDIKAKFIAMYPSEQVKAKLFDQIAEEAIKRLNGTSMAEQEYDANLNECASILYTYSTVTLLEFGQLVAKAQEFDRIVSEHERAQAEAQNGIKQEQGDPA
jgi:hypothetical protein